MPMVSWPLIVGLILLQFAVALLPGRGWVLRLQVQRKIQHALSALVLVYLYGWVLPYRAALLCLGGAIVFAYCIHRLRSRLPLFNAWLIRHFDVLLRRREYVVLPGAFWLLVGAWFTFALFARPIAVLCLLYVGLGDPSAGLVNAWLAAPSAASHCGNVRKTWFGMLAMALVCGACTLFYVPFSGWLGAVWIGVGGGLPAWVERYTQDTLDDNVSVPLITGSVLTFLLLLG